jgi:hypothetical protein
MTKEVRIIVLDVKLAGTETNEILDLTFISHEIIIVAVLAANLTISSSNIVSKGLSAFRT